MFVHKTVYVFPASVARHLYIRAPCGVGAFTKVYGGRKRRGTIPSHFCPANGGIIRKILQNLEQLNLVEKDSNGYAYVLITLDDLTVFLCLKM